jgi:hypothetical protein
MTMFGSNAACSSTPRYDESARRAKGRWRDCGSSAIDGVKDDIREMRNHAARFRRLASIVEDHRNRTQLLDLASELDKGADALEASRKQPRRWPRTVRTSDWL